MTAGLFPDTSGVAHHPFLVSIPHFIAMSHLPSASLLDTQHVDPPTLSTFAAPPSGVADLEHRNLRHDEFWRQIPAFQHASSAEFHTHTFQARHSVSNVRQLQDALQHLVPESFLNDVAAGLARAPMALRISPYLLSLIDWDEPYTDPIRTQFLPLASQQLRDHRETRLDSLGEQRDSPVPGLTHRYADKALFLPI